MEKTMLNAIDKELLKAVADLDGIPKGAFNIRKNGKLLAREVSANIEIDSNKEVDGIIIRVAPGTVNETVHIPVILSQAGLHDVVYNTFIIGENADVTIVAGCGIHCGGGESEGHSGIHEFQIGRKAKVHYVEKHTSMGSGKGKRILNPTTRVFMETGAHAEMELTQLGGVDEAKRINEAHLGAGSSLLMTERVMTDGDQTASSNNKFILAGSGSKANTISRSVVKGCSRQELHMELEARAKSFGHIECDAIIMDNGVNITTPTLKALHPEAEMTHEASIGKIADDQLMKLMSLGMTYDEAVNIIVQGFLS